MTSRGVGLKLAMAAAIDETGGVGRDKGAASSTPVLAAPESDILKLAGGVVTGQKPGSS